ncbi:MAG: acetyl/propionyl/methylcrotonyl-CoA carboxylase subunit alpha [Pseudolabrys sp.]
MFRSVLIANRGEIACRIARTARRMGIRTIAVYSDVDATALHVRECDEAYAIGPAPAAESYLVIDKLIAAARQARAECIHPGYGFLSENVDFAEACVDAGLVFIGPPASAIRAMGLKHHAKTLMEKAGVSVVPGYHGEMQEPKFLRQKAYEIGYPVIIKPLAGGGGKGMRRVERHADFDAALEGAQREAKSSFGDARILVEKYVASPRHIEMQIFADRHGNAIHLGERDCSLQRRHQKVMEESPAPGMTAELRTRMGAAAVAAAKAAGYVGAGTVEFIADATNGLKAGSFWFMEMNTRLQVEHPVTEAVTGLDLVEWQFRVAAGEELPLMQDQIATKGHAVEARLYAEDPERGFLPSTGRLFGLQFPEIDGLRIDTGVECGSEVTPFYDPMVAKLIAYGQTRDEAFDRLAAALERTIVAGPRSNIGFLTALCRAAPVRAGEFDTGFIDGNLADLGAVPQGLDRSAAAFGTQWLLAQDRLRASCWLEDTAEESQSPWDVADAFQTSGVRRLTLPILANGEFAVAEVVYTGKRPELSVEGVAPDPAAIAIAGSNAVFVLRHGRQTKVSMRDPSLAEPGSHDKSGLIRAPMHGKVLTVLVEKGVQVTRGQRVAIIEAMKMEHTIVAPIDGVVTEIVVAKDAQIAEGAQLMTVAPPITS